MHSLTNDAATATHGQRGRRLACGCSFALAALLAAGAAHAGTAELTQATLTGLRAYFSDPANVRGMLGAALGAIVSVAAARTFAPGGTGDSDER